jgi:hypothetical protein
VTGNTTTFEKSGDPVAGTGWLDAGANDKRFIMASGPFTMAPGDTQRIALAIIVGRGRNRLVSVKLMKELDLVAQAAYDAGFKGQFLPITEGQVDGGGAAGPGKDDSQPADFNAARPPASESLGFGVRVELSPSRDRVGLSVTAAQPGAYKLEVIDTRGRLVRTLYCGSLSAVQQSITWDGRDDTGDAAAAGIYFARLACQAAGLSESAKMVLLR